MITVNDIQEAFEKTEYNIVSLDECVTNPNVIYQILQVLGDEHFDVVLIYGECGRAVDFFITYAFGPFTMIVHSHTKGNDFPWSTIEQFVIWFSLTEQKIKQLAKDMTLKDGVV